MASVDVSSIVPSTRDFQQAIATRRKRLGLVAVVDDAADAGRLADLGVRAVAMKAPGESMAKVAAAVTLPMLSLATLTAADDHLLARASGADAVVIDASDAKAFDERAKKAKSTRMAALALVTDHDAAKRAAATGSKSFLLRVYGAEPIESIVALLPGGAQIVAELPAADEKALRALVGKVDAAVVASELYLSTSFDTLRMELDPD